MKLLLLGLFAALLCAAPLHAQDKVYPTGRVAPPKERLVAVHAESWAKHGARIRALASRSFPESFDSRAFGWIPTPHDQGDCGSCHWFSACGVGSIAFIKGGTGDVKAFWLSPQAALDCGQGTGGCGGGWEWDDAKWIMDHGLPIEADYGAYTARAHQCRSAPKLFKIVDMGMCSQGDGVARTEDIKAAIVARGSASVAVAADNAFMRYTGGLFEGSGSDRINHAVLLCGWKTVNGKLYWLLMNSWSPSWGEAGFMWIREGANQVGDSAFWVAATALPPPPPPPPPTPGSVSITLTLEQVAAVLAAAGQPNVQITESTTLAELMALLRRLEPPAATKPATPPAVVPVPPVVTVPPVPAVPAPKPPEVKPAPPVPPAPKPPEAKPEPIKEAPKKSCLSDEDAERIRELLTAHNNAKHTDAVRARVAALDARTVLVSADAPPIVEAPVVVTIERVEPTDGVPGDRVRIFGQGLRDLEAVLFGLTRAPFEESAGAILCQVPVGVQFGRLSITVKTRGGAVSNPIPFLVGAVSP